MSEIQVGQINSTDGSTAITTGADGYVSFAKTQIGGRRNLIINGAMQVAQRGTSASAFDTNYRVLDRYKLVMVNTGTFTVSQSTDAPPDFGYSYKLECTTADATIANADNMGLHQRIEGQDLQHLNHGTANAKAMTLSFWVKSNKTGTYVSWIYKPESDRHVASTYTIDTADTWEYKTLTIPADTSGAIDNDNGFGLRIDWMLVAGPNYLTGTLPSSWESNTLANRFVGHNVNLADTVGNTWQITGVQLEVGTVATPFEHRSYGEELALCQRYFYSTIYARGASSTTDSVQLQGARHQFADVMGYRSQLVSHPVTMRSDPSVVVYNPSNSGATGQFRLYAHNGSTQNFAGFTYTKEDSIKFCGYTGVSVGSAGLSTEAWVHYECDAEL